MFVIIIINYFLIIIYKIYKFTNMDRIKQTKLAKQKKNTRKRKNKQKNKLVKKLCCINVENPKINQIGYLSRLDFESIDQQNKLVLEFASKIKSSDVKKVLDKYKNEAFVHPTSFILGILKNIYYFENSGEYSNYNYVDCMKNDLVKELIFKQRFGDDYFNARLLCDITGHTDILSLSYRNYIDGYLLD